MSGGLDARVVAVASLLGVIGCGGGGLLLEREIAVGRFEDAARTFESDSTLWSNPEALLLAGRLYADPSLPTFDIERAVPVLMRLIVEFPMSEEANRARPLATLVAELERVRVELEASTAELEGRAALADTLTALTASREAAERDVEAMRRRIERLEAELEEARRELERLKAVDLRPRPGTPR
jgi:hypothetical protein